MTTVFIVEDDISIVTLYEMFLESNGFKTIRALNGERAIQIYKSLSNKPDIILMDHRMPIKNGLDAMTEILGIYNQEKVIFASADISIKQEALTLGACAFLDKPFNIDKLLSIIQRILGDFCIEC